MDAYCVYGNDLSERGMKKPIPSQDFLLSVFDYDQESGVLTWKHRADMPAKWNARFAGKRAGTVTSHPSRPYRQVTINYICYHEHRIIWKMIHGFDPIEVDHRDLDALNNRIRNLRNATRSNNLRNTRGRSRLGLPKGVTRHSQNGYQASIRLNGKRTYVGWFKTPEQAHAAYAAAAKQHFGEFARTE